MTDKERGDALADAVLVFLQETDPNGEDYLRLNAALIEYQGRPDAAARMRQAADRHEHDMGRWLDA